MATTAWLTEHVDAVWPDVARRVRVGLEARGVRADVAEDAVQEAAARLWCAQPDVASTDELARWLFTVARNVVLDAAKRRGHRVPLGEAAGAPGPATVEAAAVARVELARVLRAVGTLSETDRTALVAALVGDVTPRPADRRDAVRAAVRLHRARARLLDALGGLGGVAGIAWRRLRSLVTIAADSTRRAIAIGAAVVGVVLLGPWTSPPDAADAAPMPPAPPAPVETSPVPAQVAGPAPANRADAAAAPPSGSRAAAASADVDVAPSIPVPANEMIETDRQAGPMPSPVTGTTPHVASDDPAAEDPPQPDRGFDPHDPVVAIGSPVGGPEDPGGGVDRWSNLEPLTGDEPLVSGSVSPSAARTPVHTPVAAPEVLANPVPGDV